MQSSNVPSSSSASNSSGCIRIDPTLVQLLSHTEQQWVASGYSPPSTPTAFSFASPGILSAIGFGESTYQAFLQEPIEGLSPDSTAATKTEFCLDEQPFELKEVKANVARKRLETIPEDTVKQVLEHLTLDDYLKPQVPFIDRVLTACVYLDPHLDQAASRVQEILGHPQKW